MQTVRTKLPASADGSTLHLHDLAAMKRQQLCEHCEGSGHVALGEHFVTHDMALDAGEPQLEGQSMGVEYGACEHCGGDGWNYVEEPTA